MASLKAERLRAELIQFLEAIGELGEQGKQEYDDMVKSVMLWITTHEQEISDANESGRSDAGAD